jgi:phosphate-selective porin OprO/OprP
MPSLTARTSRSVLVVALSYFLFASSASGQSQEPQSADRTAELERRVRELEEIVRHLPPEAKQPAPAPAPEIQIPVVLTVQSAPSEDAPPLPMPSQVGDAKPKEVDASAGSQGDKKEGDKKSSDAATPVAGWKDGFFLQSKEKDFVLRITGQIQADYRAFVEQADGVDVDSFFLRRARLGIEANMYQYYEFRFLPDYGQGKAVIQDAYMNVHYWDEFQFEVGKFKQPVSYEQLIQDRFVPTMERSLIDQLVPQRDEGVMVHGQKLFGNRLDYAIAVSNGEINGDFDTNEHKDVNARVAVRPWHDEEDCDWPLLQWLQFGVSGGFGVEQEPIAPNILRTPATVPWFQFNSTVQAAGVRSRLTPEVSYFFHSLGMAAQYYHEEQEVRPGISKAQFPRLEEVRYDGFYYLFTYLLTGEERTTYSEAVTPLRPFNPSCPFHSPGAWELVARVSRLDLNDGVFTPGPAQLANPRLFSRGATEMTLGYNWYLNKWVRMQFNWEHAWFDDPVQLGSSPRNLTIDSDTLMTRFQIIF